MYHERPKRMTILFKNWMKVPFTVATPGPVSTSVPTRGLSGLVDQSAQSWHFNSLDLVAKLELWLDIRRCHSLVIASEVKFLCIRYLWNEWCFISPNLWQRVPWNKKIILDSFYMSNSKNKVLSSYITQLPNTNYIYEMNFTLCVLLVHDWLLL